jgi:hypothetical protein
MDATMLQEAIKNAEAREGKKLIKIILAAPIIRPESKYIKEILNEVSGVGWMLSRCIFCGKELNLLNADYSTGDPQCSSNCSGELHG